VYVEGDLDDYGLLWISSVGSRVEMRSLSMVLSIMKVAYRSRGQCAVLAIFITIPRTGKCLKYAFTCGCIHLNIMSTWTRAMILLRPSKK